MLRMSTAVNEVDSEHIIIKKILLKNFALCSIQIPSQQITQILGRLKNGNNLFNSV